MKTNAIPKVTNNPFALTEIVLRDFNQFHIQKQKIISSPVNGKKIITDSDDFRFTILIYYPASSISERSELLSCIRAQRL
jgi:hypothetical protein